MTLTQEDIQAIASMLDVTLDRKLNERLTPIQEDINGLKVDVAELKANVTKLNADMVVMKADMTVMKADVAKLKTDVTGLEKNYHDLKKVMVTKKDLRESERMLLSEMEHLHNIHEKRFDRTDQMLATMREEINATRYSNDTVVLLMEKESELERRVAHLEKRA